MISAKDLRVRWPALVNASANRFANGFTKRCTIEDQLRKIEDQLRKIEDQLRKIEDQLREAESLKHPSVSWILKRILKTATNFRALRRGPRSLPWCVLCARPTAHGSCGSTT